MYIAEIAPASMRGRFVSLNQLTTVLGILAAQLVNWQIAEPVAVDATTQDILNSWNGQTGWRWMFWIEVIPAGLFFILMYFVAKSPRWLSKKGNDVKVQNILTRIGGSQYATSEYHNIRKSLTSSTDKVNFRELRLSSN